jgi:acetyl esterase
MKASSTHSPMDVELERVSAILKERGLASPPPHTVLLHDARNAYDNIGCFLSTTELPLPFESLLWIPGPHGPIRCHVYRFERAAPTPAMIYFHGGGFCMGEVSGWHGLMRQLARASGACIFSVDYRLAPEHRFPVAFDEVVAAVQFIAQHAQQNGVDEKRLALGGDSAGANLALAAACSLRDAGQPALAMLLLFYGVYSPEMTSVSWLQFGDGQYGLSRATMEWSWSTYLRSVDQRGDWRASPLLASMHDLPFVYMNVGSLDPLQDDALALQRKLTEAGVEHELAICPGAPHGFIRMGSFAQVARQAVADAARAFRERTGGEALSHQPAVNDDLRAGHIL